MTHILCCGAAVLILSASSAFALENTMTEGHLDMLDLDKDGAVDVTEYRVYTSNAFIALDADNDDKLAPADVASFLPDVLFEAMDKDADGIVTRTEYDTQVLLDFHAADADKNGVLN